MTSSSTQTGSCNDEQAPCHQRVAPEGFLTGHRSTPRVIPWVNFVVDDGGAPPCPRRRACSCWHCRCFGRGMDILTLLRRDHDDFFDEIAALEARLEPGAFERSTVRSRGHALITRLQIHARGEELSLYAALFGLARAPPDVREHLDRKGREGVCEHKSIDDAAHRLLLLLDDDKALRADILAEATVLRELLEHHARVEEEGELFPEVEARFSLQERQAMGAELESLRLALSSAPERLRQEAVLAT